MGWLVDGGDLLGNVNEEMSVDLAEVLLPRKSLIQFSSEGVVG